MGEEGLDRIASCMHDYRDNRMSAEYVSPNLG